MKNLIKYKDKAITKIELINDQVAYTYDLDNTKELDSKNLFDVELRKIVLFDSSIELQLLLVFRDKKVILLGTFNKGKWFITLDGYSNEYLTFAQVRVKYGNLLQLKIKNLLKQPKTNQLRLNIYYKLFKRNLQRTWTNSH